MPTLRIMLADPRVVVIKRPDVIELVSGLIEGDSLAFDPTTSDDGLPEARVCRDIGDATVIRIDLFEEVPRRVRIWKGITSGFEVYYSIRNGDILLADHFKNILTLLPPTERGPSEEAILDHFMFRHVRGHSTYCRNVWRPGHGEMVQIDLPLGKVTTHIFDRLESSSKTESVERYIAGVDHALSRVLEPLRSASGVVNMLSGGVDSTLIQTYFGRQVPALNVVPDSDAFSLGGKNAPAVAQFLDVDFQRVVVHQAEFLSQLEAAIDRRGLPPNYPQWVTLTRVFNLPHAEFVVGERADALFARPGNRTPYFARHFSKAPGSLLLPLLGVISARTHRRRLQLLAQQAEALRHDPLSPLGFASQISIYADMGLTERTFGRDRVNERLRARLEYILPRVKLLTADADRYVRHLEVAQWRTFYNEHILLLRHLAFAYGKSLIAPYNSGPVVASALAVPPAQRYSDGLQSKYILKRLLAQRLPAYNTKRKKDDIVIPFRQYYTNGPLAGIWSKYEVPDIFSGDARKQLIEQPSESTWNAVTFAIWRKRIADNATLQPTPMSIDIELVLKDQ